jgi:small subunit ribosomal protein S17
MAESTTQTAQKKLARKEVIGVVTSTRMQKTIVVEVKRQYAHHLYRRVISRSKKFYAHDEKNVARVGDVVRLEETRPLSKLKRWRLKDVVQKAALVTGEDRKAGAPAEAV